MIGEIKSLVLAFEDMCGESDTEIGRAALRELDALSDVFVAAQKVVEKTRSGDWVINEDNDTEKLKELERAVVKMRGLSA